MEPKRKKDIPVLARGDREQDDQKEKWCRTLETINERLRKHGLPTLKTLGNHLDGEDEILGLIGVHGYGESVTHPEPYYYIVTYWCKAHDGKERPYAVMINAKHTMLPAEGRDVAATGAVCFTTFNDEWAVLLRQHRGPAVGVWTVEMPRGFIPHGGLSFARLPSPRKFQPVDMDLAGVTTSDLPLGIVKDELATFLKGGQVTAERLRLLAFPWENTGVSANITPIFHLSLRGDPALVTNLKVWSQELGTRKFGPKHQQVVFAPLSRLHEDYMRVGLNSIHCLAALQLHRTYTRAARPASDAPEIP